MLRSLLAKLSDMPTVIPQPAEEMKSMCVDGVTEGAGKLNTPPPNKKAVQNAVQNEKDIDEGNQFVDMPPKQTEEISNDDKEVRCLIHPEKLEEGDPKQPTKTKPRWRRKIRLILCFISIVLGIIIATALSIIAIYLNQMHRHLPHVKPSPVNFHHAFFHLKTGGYEKMEKPTNLQWLNDNSQNVGDIKLVDGCYFHIPQDGLYQINFAIQLNIPKDTPASVVTLMLKRKNNEKDYVFMKKSSSSLTIPEHDVIQSSFRYKLKADEKVFVMMNMAKFISRNNFSSYLYISRLNINNHH
ncbi:XP_029650685.1uncharacterized protein LOC115224028 [Octopus vulgaris]|uniref:XP_029650685.1uncharacterized protein LOC115224028 n=1 Tax=Octopus vulgaris TaxID=6645 RepID=A0AA36FNG2_OCTVU|nr:XP_029650685.1uncharacterized protein LOC115224028 [Octopus vulgaris]